MAAGADAIGLNVVDGTPRALELDEAAALPRLARTAGAGDRRPLVVAITADADQARIEAAIAAFDPDAVQLSGNERVGAATGVVRRTWKVLHLPAADPATLATDATTSCRGLAATSPAAPPGSSSTRPADRIRAGPARVPRNGSPRRSLARCR